MFSNSLYVNIDFGSAVKHEENGKPIPYEKLKGSRRDDMFSVGLVLVNGFIFGLPQYPGYVEYPNGTKVAVSELKLFDFKKKFNPNFHYFFRNIFLELEQLKIKIYWKISKIILIRSPKICTVEKVVTQKKITAKNQAMTNIVKYLLKLITLIVKYSNKPVCKINCNAFFEQFRKFVHVKINK